MVVGCAAGRILRINWNMLLSIVWVRYKCRSTVGGRVLIMTMPHGSSLPTPRHCTRRD